MEKALAAGWSVSTSATGAFCRYSDWRFFFYRSRGAKPKVTVTAKLRPAISPGVSPPLIAVGPLVLNISVVVVPGIVTVDGDPARERL